MVRSADPTRPDLESSSAPFAAQLALARVHPALAPLRESRDGYTLDLLAAPNWYALPQGRGLAGYGLARALRMLLDVLAGLTALHETLTADGVGFVHGEVVPALVRVDPRGVAHLQPLAPWHWQAVEAPLARASVGHLAPERLLGDAIDRRADVYGAGVLLWEALAGKRLFEHDSVDEIITRLMGGKVLLPELPPELVWAIPLKAVAMRALSVDPEQRFSDCPELAAAIEAVARGRVASHAMVAAHFAAPARPRSSLPPPLARVPSVEEAYRSSHKSSLSALVAPSSGPRQTAEHELEPLAKGGRAGRAAWTVAALVSLCAAIGVAAFTRHNQTYTAAHEALPSASPAPSALGVSSAGPAAISAAASPESAAAGLPDPPASNGSALVREAPSATPDRSARPSKSAPPPRDYKGHAAPNASKVVAPGKPARIHDSEAEQYGI